MSFLDLDSIKFISEGAVVTFNFTIASFAIGFLIGIAMVLMKISNCKLLQFLASLYISIFRGTPVLVQLSIFYFAFPHLLGIKMSAYEAGIITFSCNSAAYIAEILRSGINSVNIGQFEAAKALNIPYALTMQKIILPQAIRVALPALVNEFVNLLKETAIVSFIGVYDLMKRAQVVSAEKYIYFEPLLIAAGCYYLMVVAFSSIAKYIEHRIN